jgi:hypothetical protein
MRKDKQKGRNGLRDSLYIERGGPARQGEQRSRDEMVPELTGQSERARVR